MRTRRDYARTIATAADWWGEAAGPAPAPHPRRRPRQRPAPAGRAAACTARSTPRTNLATGARSADPSRAAAAGDRVHRRPGRPGRAEGLRAGCARSSSRPRPRSAPTVVWVMGNHDEREPYARELFGEAAQRRDDPGPRPRGRRAAGGRARHHACPATTTASSPRTSWPGWPTCWPTPAPHGTLIALHHPPIPVPMMRAAEMIELLRPAPAGRGDRGHRRARRDRWPLPLLVVLDCSRACRSRWPRPPATWPTRHRRTGCVSEVDGHQSVTMMHLYEDRIVHSVVPVPDARGDGRLPVGR